MKLKLKQLAPYLPYGLKCRFSKDEIYTIVGLVNENVYLKELTYPADLFLCKPIFRPLSDLIKEIEHNGEKFVPLNKLSEVSINIDILNRNKDLYGGFKFSLHESYIIGKTNKIGDVPCYNNYGIIQKLIEWHFDVFGLIESGLAIDINTLEK